MATHRRFHLFGNLIHFHKYSTETNGRFCLVEDLVAPGAGAPPNRHAAEEEVFIVLDGQFEFSIDGQTRVAGPGEVVTVPTGAAHSFVNSGDAPGRVIIVNAPGTIHDTFFSTAGEAVPEDSWTFPAQAEPDIPRVMAAAAAAGLEVLPPDA